MWQPIEAVPRDGRDVLVYTMWRGRFDDAPPTFQYQIGFWSMGRLAVQYGEPLYWAELLEPPETSMWIDPSYHDDAGHFVERNVITIDPENITAPFDVKRVYFLHDTKEARGGHAHRKLHQLAHCPVGSCVFNLEDAAGRKWSVKLDHPTKGLLIGPGIWRTMRDFSPDCVLTVLADAPYDESDYIREYIEWKHEVLIPLPA